MIKVADCSLGVNKDLMPEELPPGAWTDCRNMRFAKGFAERIGGIYNQFAAPAVTPYYLAYYQTATTNFWVHAGLAAVYVDDGTTRTDITGSVPTGGIDDRYTGGVIGGIFILNNGVDNPMFWNGDTVTNLATLTAWDTNEKCKSMRVFKQFLIAMDVSKSGTRYRHMVKWSAAALPGALPSTWDETDATKEAREIELSETSDPIIDGLALGDSFVVYKERSMFRLTYIGGEFTFRRERIPSPFGLMARGCVAETPVGHVGMSVGDIFLFDGVSAVSIADSRVREWIFQTMDRDNFERSFVVTNPTKSEVLICFPSRGQTSCNKAAVWNWNEKKWGLRDLPATTYGATGLVDDATTVVTWTSMTPATWTAWTGAWFYETLSLNQTRLMLCRTAPAISAYDFGNTDAGTAIEWHLERTGMAYDGDVKLFKDVFPVFDAPAGTVVSVQLGAAMRPDEAPVYQTAVDYTVGTDFKINAMCKGRAGAIRFSGDSSGAVRLRSYSIGVQPAGKF